MFDLVIGIVTILVWFKPRNLTCDKRAHLLDRGKIPYGTEQQSASSEKRFEAGEKEEKGGAT